MTVSRHASVVQVFLNNVASGNMTNMINGQMKREYPQEPRSNSKGTIDTSEHSTMTADGTKHEDNANGDSTHITCPSPTPERPVSITFKPSVRVRVIPSHRELTPQETDAVWFTEKELADIRKQARLMVSMANRGRMEEDDPRLLGLGCRTVKGQRRKRDLRHKAWDAVLEEQDWQLSEETSDPELISMAYLTISAEARSDAFHAGRRQWHSAKYL